MSDQLQTVVAQRADSMPSTTTAATTDPRAFDLDVIAMAPWKIVLVRGTRVYLQSWLGFMTAGGLGLDANILPNDLAALAWTSAQLALAPVAFTIIQNTIELLAKLDVSFPQARA